MAVINASDWEIREVSTGVVAARNRITGQEYQGDRDGLNALIAAGTPYTPSELKERERLQKLGVVTGDFDPLTRGIKNLQASGNDILQVIGKRRGFDTVLFGDSFTARNQTTAGRELDWGYFNWANNFLNRPFRVVLNAGVSGERTDQMLTRIGTAIDAAPDWVFVLGGIEDIVQGYAADQVIANLQSICAKFAATSANVVLVSIAPNDQTAGNSTKIHLVNKAMKEWCLSSGLGIVFADIYSAMVNPTSTTGALATGMSDDSLHPSAKGARVAGKAVADTIRSLLPTRNCLVSSAAEDYAIDATAKQLLANPLMAGTGGTVSGDGASGTLADSWLGGTSTGTVTSVFVAGQTRTDGIGLNQRITISAAETDASVSMWQPDVHTKVAIGDTIYASVATLEADTAPTGIVAGQFAVIETGNVNDAENSRLYLWNGSAYSYVTDLSGSQGITGPQGSTGYTGSQGIQGVQGDVGYTGSQGVQGIQGPQGIQGVTGYTGSQGAQGDIGYTGSQGTAGATGYTGSAGADAATYTGDTAPASPANGDLWFDTTNGRLKLWYVDTDSSQWVDAAVGSTGYTGSSGASIAAVDASAPADPVIGQLWYDTANTTLKIYLAGGWTAV